MQDAELLRDYLTNDSEAAFAELVKRYADFVYSTARRQLNDPDLAQEVAQSVFCLLARKGAGLAGRETLAGWLYRATCFTAARTLRAERRRRLREQEAATMNQPEEDGTWKYLSPMLNSALNELGEKDRLAVLLRFFQRKPMREIGATLGVSEDAAKMRVSRAVEQLRGFFARRGVTCSSSALGVLLTERGVEAAPAMMASRITTAVLSGAAFSTLSFVQTLIFMAQMNARSLITIGAGSLVLVSVGLPLWHAYASLPAKTTQSLAVAPLNPADEGGNRNGFTGLSARAPGRSPASSLSAGVDLNGATSNLLAVLNAPGQPYVPSMREAISRFGPEKEAAFAILKAQTLHPRKTATNDPRLVQEKAVFGIGFLGTSVPEAIPFLWQAYDLPGSKEGNAGGNSVALLALSAIQRIGLQPSDIVPLSERVLGLTDTNQDTSGIIRAFAANWVAGELRNHPNATWPFVPTVEGLLRSPNAQVRFWTACALLRYEGAENPAVIQAIRAGLRSGNRGTVVWASNLVFDTAGPAAKPLVPDILAAYKAGESGDPEDGWLIAGKIDPDLRKTLPGVDRALTRESNRKSFVSKLKSGAITYEELLAGLKDPALAPRASAALAEMGPAVAGCVPDIMQALQNTDFTGIQQQMLEDIHRIDPEEKVIQLESPTVLKALDEAFQGSPSDERARFEQIFRARDPVMSGHRLVPAYYWFTMEDFSRFANDLAAQDLDAYRTFARVLTKANPGLKDAFQSPPR